MKRKSYCLYLTLWLLMLAGPALAQEPTPALTARNTFFAELYGNGGQYSLNFDRVFFQSGRFKSSLRVGASIRPARVNLAGDRFVVGTLPLELNGLWGGGSHHLEMGLGFTPGYHGRATHIDSRSFHAYSARLGYRYQKPGGGLFFRAGLTPSLRSIKYPNLERKYHLNWAHGGIGLGWSF
ncbi:hypothetical protein BH24BAC1_BH24BAC1_38330 [soil metagenome]